ncbi:hypothetical protein HPP92_019510 [Vanilla planifolia]|uniref:Uncharacterized protein n=1 Tax=Vanilla planifolia TaxID=51239 RepID=A0A835Q3F9_VANPL|nr:hypothetical protein HPP92_019510 [Vanilla planifolia]
MAGGKDDASDIHLLSILYQDHDCGEENEEDEAEPSDNRGPEQTADPPAERRHLLASIGAEIVIRQLPSQGLSFQLWPAAFSFVSLLDRDPSALLLPSDSAAIPLRILELGSGTGLVGIAAAAILGAHVTLTDLPHVLPNLEFNALANSGIVSARGGSITVRQLRWGASEDVSKLGFPTKFDAVLASDVVYYDHLFNPLLETLRVMVTGEVAFLMAHLRRWKKRDAVFFRLSRKLFEVEVVHTDPPQPGCRTGVTIYRFMARKKPPSLALN